MQTTTELIAGRELDALVAEKVMGLTACADWQEMNFGMAGGPAVTKRCSHANGTCYPTLELPSVLGMAGGCSKYSTDIAAAWQVVEKIGGHIDIIHWGDHDTWQVNIHSGTRAAWAETAPLAICRAALAAVSR